MTRDRRWAFPVTGLALADSDGQGPGGPEPGRRGARGGAKARERECACASGGAFSGAVGGSRSASPEVIAAAGRPLPLRGWCRRARWAGQAGLGGVEGRSLGSALPRSSASGRTQTRAQPSPLVPRFPFSYPVNAPSQPPHHGDGSARGELPTWQLRLCLCFPPGGMLVSAPSLGKG